MSKNYFLNKSAKDAYRSYLLAYASHGLKNIFNVHTLDLLATARAFGFTVPPRVNLNIASTGDSVRRRGGGGGFGGREAHRYGHGVTTDGKKAGVFRQGGTHAFSASNPYGKRQQGDSRQLVRY